MFSSLRVASVHVTDFVLHVKQCAVEILLTCYGLQLRYMYVMSCVPMMLKTNYLEGENFEAKCCTAK